MDIDAQAVILLGGKGTRIASLFPDRPKALVPVCGRPFLEWQLEWLGRGGIHHIHLAAGHMAGVLHAWLEEKSGRNAADQETRISSPGLHVSSRSEVSGFRLQVSDFDLCVSISSEPEPLGTGGGLKFVTPFLKGDRFFVLNGDSLAPSLDFRGLEDAYRRSSNAWTTIAVAPIEEAGRYGTVEFESSGRVTAFREKAHHARGWINAGVYVMNRRVLDLIEPRRAVSMETEVFPRLAAGGYLYARPTSPPLLDMGTVEGLEAMRQFLRPLSGSTGLSP